MSTSIWAQIDELKSKHEAELSRVHAAISKLGGGGKPSVDAYGFWRVSFKNQALKARSGNALVALVKKAAAGE